MRRAAGEPGELVGEFETLVIDPLGESGIAAECQRRDPLAAVREIGGDLHPCGREREVPPRSSLMKLPLKYDVREANTPSPRVERVPPVAGTARLPTRVGSCESQLPSRRSVSVWASDAFQSRRSRARVVVVLRSAESPETDVGAPLAAASAMNRPAESGLTPRRTSVPASAVVSEGSASPRQRPCSAPNTNNLFETIGPPIPPLSWFCVEP